MYTTPAERAAWAATLKAVSPLKHKTLPIDADDLRRLLDDADFAARLVQEAYASLCAGDPMLCGCQLEITEPEVEEPFYLTDRQFGPLLGRFLAQGVDRSRVRRRGRRYDDLNVVAPLRILPGLGCRDLAAFHDRVSLLVRTNEEQRARVDQVLTRRGMPPFFPSSTSPEKR